MAELNFEWDEEKNAANIKNHGVDFLDAALIFEKTQPWKPLTIERITAN